MEEQGGRVVRIDRPQLAPLDRPLEDVRKDGLHTAQPLMDLGVLRFRHMLEKVHGEPVDLRLIELPVVDQRNLPKLLFDRLIVQIDLREIAQDPVHQLRHHIGKERFLAAEVVIERRLAQSGDVGNLLHRHPQVPLFDEEAPGDIDDALPAGWRHRRIAR